MSYERTALHRERQRQAIHRWKPWNYSTGPRTSAGKTRSSRRGYKGGQRLLARAVARCLRQQLQDLKGERVTD